MTLSLPPQAVVSNSLYYSSDQEPGFTRRKWGRGFQYLDERRQKLNCKKLLKRIKALVIPPLWKKVWICKNENGHLQSTGRDLRSRKQYIYHPDWIAYRQAEKFSKMLDFANQLPQLRATLDCHLKYKSWNREKVLALAVKVLDQYHIRIGNKQYATRNGTYGLTTLRRKHMETETGGLLLSYKAKSNKHRKVSIDSPILIRLIRSCSALPGHEIFQYRSRDGQIHSIDSSDVNDYIRSIMGDSFSAKDFRTWGGSSYAVKFFTEAKRIVAENPRKKLDKTIVKLVSKELGNTISVCRKYYIHPKVLAFLQKEVINWENLTIPAYLEDYEVVTKNILSTPTPEAPTSSMSKN